VGHILTMSAIYQDWPHLASLSIYVHRLFILSPYDINRESVIVTQVLKPVQNWSCFSTRTPSRSSKKKESWDTKSEATTSLQAINKASIEHWQVQSYFWEILLISVDKDTKICGNSYITGEIMKFLEMNSKFWQIKSQ